MRPALTFSTNEQVLELLPIYFQSTYSLKQQLLHYLVFEAEFTFLIYHLWKTHSFKKNPQKQGPADWVTPVLQPIVP